MKIKTFGYLLIAIIAYSCSTQKTIEQSANSSMFENFDEFQIDNDRKYNFNCGGKSYNVVGKNINRNYFPVELRNCLLEEGFGGNQEANFQIANLIKMVKMDGFLVFGPHSKFRGPQVFEALLSIGDDFSPIIDYEDDTVQGTKAQAFGSKYIKMIKSIEGKDYLTFMGEILKSHKVKVPEYDPETLNYNFEHDVERSKLKYSIIEAAWKEGKIILKDFGEE